MPRWPKTTSSPHLDWPDLSAEPTGHEEHTKLLFDVIDRILAHTNNYRPESSQETQTIDFIAAFASFVKIYANYTAHIMGSGQTLATKQDINILMADIQKLIKDLGDDRQYNWEDDDPHVM